MIQNYTFCPLCGYNIWTVHNAGRIDDARLEFFTCKDCEKFNYRNHIKIIDPIKGLCIVSLYDVCATIENFKIVVLFHMKITSIFELGINNSDKLLLSVNKCIDFDWYFPKDVLTQIKKYLLFS